MEGWLHLTAGAFAGMDINPNAKGVGCYIDNNRLHIALGNGRSILVEQEDEDETINRLLDKI